MARMSKINYQIHCRMQEMLCLNESRHKAKQEYKEMIGENSSNRTIGIHSYKTYDAYKQTSIEFIRDIKQEFVEETHNGYNQGTTITPGESEVGE